MALGAFFCVMHLLCVSCVFSLGWCLNLFFCSIKWSVDNCYWFAKRETKE